MKKVKASGFLLIEIMISLMLLASVATIIAKYVYTIIDLNQQASMHTQALLIATNFLEKVMVEKKLGAAIASAPFTLESALLPFNTQPSQLLSGYHYPSLKMVNVTIKWQNTRKDNSLTLQQIFAL